MDVSHLVGKVMTPLRLELGRLVGYSPAAAIGAWFDGKRIVGRRGDGEDRAAGSTSAVAIAHAAFELLPTKSTVRAAIADACTRLLQMVSPTGPPWNTYAERDDPAIDTIASVYTTSRVLLDLGANAIDVVPADVLERGYKSLQLFLGDPQALSRVRNLPFVYRSAMALHKAHLLEDAQRAAIGLVAQRHLETFVARHALS